MNKRVIALVIATVSISNILIYSGNSFVAHATEKRIDEANEELDEVVVKVKEMEAEMQKLKEEIDSVQANIDNIETRNTALEKENKIIKKDIEDAKLEKEEKYKLIKSVMKIQYEQSKTGYLNLLLESTDFSNFLMRFELVSNLIKNSNYLVEEIKKLEDELNEKSNKLQVQIQEIKDKKKVAKEEKDKLQNLVWDSQYEKNKLINLQNQLESEIKKLETEIANSASGGKYQGGEMVWPVPGYTTISSYFGNRADPFTGKPEYHNAIDIPAPAGASVVSGNSGTVITAGYSSSYGNLVVVDHGGGVLTYYAHNTSLLVSVGQSVSKGQQIATVGTTGNSTGNHLHFGVQLNGKFVDPMNYLTK